MVRFRERYPGVRLRVLETDSAGAVEQILSRRADIGFAGTVLEEKQCVYIPFYQDELVVIIPGEGLEGPESAAETAAWIRRMPVILREEGSGTRKEAQRLLRQMGIAVETGGKRNINLVFDRRSLHSTEAEKLIDLVKEMYPDNV